MIEVVLAVALAVQGSGFIWLLDRSAKRAAEERRLLVNHLMSSPSQPFQALQRASNPVNPDKPEVDPIPGPLGL